MIRLPARSLSVTAVGMLLAVACSPPATAGLDASGNAGTPTIGAVQGAVGDGADGTAHRSPYAPEEGGEPGETVTVDGVVTQRTLSASGDHGLFLQDTAATADDDPTTSDGIFVFLGGAAALPTAAGAQHVPQVGDELVIRGTVAEFFNLTQLTDTTVVDVLRTGVDVDTETSAFEADPPDDLAEAERYWERREGMRGLVPAGAVVLGGLDVFGDAAEGADGELWVARADSEIARREEPYARRTFRDPHPLDDVPDQLFDNANGYRILLGSYGLKGAADDPTALLEPARTFDTMSTDAVGGLYYAFGKYQIQPVEQLGLQTGVDPDENAPPTPAEPDEFAAAVYNVENLYDLRDDPFDGCDYEGNTGCEGVDPPFDYVPSTGEEYGEQLAEIATQIVEDLHAPDLLAVQEAEDQDICAVTDGELVCGETDDADGRPDTLQELALVITERGGPVYEAAFDRDGADDRGIVSAFLYRSDRVELVAPDADDPVLGADPQVDYRGEAATSNTEVSNPKALNAVLPDDVDTSTGTDGDNVFTRAPQVALFRVSTEGAPLELYAVSNHFSSGPDRRVGQRTEQAAYNAAIVDALRTADEDVRVLVGGDLNVFPRPPGGAGAAPPRSDDPFLSDPTDQLGPLYEAGLTNLYDVLLDEVPASAYSYVFDGQAQVLDHQFVTQNLRDALREVRIAHVNADYPAQTPGDGARGTSDHDPQVARFAWP